MVNLITKRPSEVTQDYFKVAVEGGSFATKALDISAGGSLGELSYTLGYKIYRSEEAGLADMAPWGFTDDTLYHNPTIWGPVLGQQNRGIQYGQYANLTKDTGMVAEVSYRQFTVGYINNDIDSGYGPYYAADRGQANGIWINANRHWYLEHEATPNDALVVKTLLSQRQSVVGGNWAEAEPDWTGANEINSPSWVSVSEWNSFSTAQMFKQDYEYLVTPSLMLSGGIKYERKALNKVYEICLYWANALCGSLDPSTTAADWPTEYGPGIYHSSADSMVLGKNVGMDVSTRSLDDNYMETRDTGIYLQSIWDNDNWRLNAGIRYDRNSLYGSTTNPRASVVWRMNEKVTFKALYGEAFQEPAPTQLFGGWTGRAANPDL